MSLPNVSLPEAARIWNVSRRTAYRLAEANLVRVVRFGRRMVVTAEEAERVRVEGVGLAMGGEPPPVALPRRGRPAGRGGR